MYDSLSKWYWSHLLIISQRVLKPSHSVFSHQWRMRFCWGLLKPFQDRLFCGLIQEIRNNLRFTFLALSSKSSQCFSNLPISYFTSNKIFNVSPKFSLFRSILYLTYVEFCSKVSFPSTVDFLSKSHWENFNFVFLSGLVHSVLTLWLMGWFLDWWPVVGKMLYF